MKLLIICPTLSDSALSASFRLIHVLNYFLNEKIHITAYVSDSDISETLKSNKYYGNLEVFLVPNNAQSNFFKKIKNRLLGVPDSMIQWGIKVKQEVLQNHNKKSFDAIFVSSPPHSLQVVGMKISKSFQIPHFTDFRDDWMGSHRLRHITPLHKFLSQRSEREVFNNSALITQAIPFVATEWKAKYPLYSAKIYPFSNGYPKSILEYKVNEKTIEYRKNTIVYFGGNYNGFVVKKFTDLRKELIQTGLDKEWMIVTGGPFEIPFLDDEVWKHYGNVSQELVYDYIYNANIHISLLPPGDLFPSRTIPLKLYTQVTTNGACIFIGNEGATTELFNGIDGVYFLNKNGWDILAKWIKENELILKNRSFKRTNIRRFSYESISKKLLHLMQEIIT